MRKIDAPASTSARTNRGVFDAGPSVQMSFVRAVIRRPPPTVWRGPALALGNSARSSHDSGIASGTSVPAISAK